MCLEFNAGLVLKESEGGSLETGLGFRNGRVERWAIFYIWNIEDRHTNNQWGEGWERECVLRKGRGIGER